MGRQFDLDGCSIGAACFSSGLGRLNVLESLTVLKTWRMCKATINCHF